MSLAATFVRILNHMVGRVRKMCVHKISFRSENWRRFEVQGVQYLYSRTADIRIPISVRTVQLFSLLWKDVERKKKERKRKNDNHEKKKMCTKYIRFFRPCWSIILSASTWSGTIYGMTRRRFALYNCACHAIPCHSMFYSSFPKNIIIHHTHTEPCTCFDVRSVHIFNTIVC